MTHQRLIAAAAGLALASAASAQTATVTLAASSTNVFPGETITVSLNVIYDTAGALPGSFGDAGLYGFGGNVNVLGDAAILTGLATSSPLQNAALDSGVTLTAGAAPLLVRAAAGRGLAGGLGENPSELMTFDLTIDPSAPEGVILLSYEGAAVLALGDVMTTFSTSPGLNQMSMAAGVVQITVAATCDGDVTTTNTNPGDQSYGVPDGIADGADLSYFVENWLDQTEPIADVTTTNTNPGDQSYGLPDGIVDGADLSYFVEQWLAGCS